MIFTIINHSYKYDVEKVARLFLPFEKFVFTDEIASDEQDSFYTAIELSNGVKQAVVKIRFSGHFASLSSTIEKDTPQQEKLVLAQILIKCLNKITGYNSPWGVLTGIRPAKLLRKFSDDFGEEAAKKIFIEDFYASKSKTDLCFECAMSEDKIISLSKPNDVSLYISIPFCPTRCSYCSFVSHSVKDAKKLIPGYIELLCKEIEETGKIVKELNLNVKTIYVGGGTPTTLSAEQLIHILGKVKESFDLKNVLEYTVEAGRPDTVTEKKLLALKSFDVTRISINPQTMQEDVLKSIGRNHTAQMTLDAFILARNLGFNNINMDLIAGLDNDTLEGFADTLQKVIDLGPESITVHSLSMKRASSLTAKKFEYDFSYGKMASEMVDLAYSKLKFNDYNPYYMYRQSKTVGNLENVGYAKQGFESLYNVYIMDETHTILACGASAVTKLKDCKTGDIERIFNYKYPYEYINNFDEILERKKKIYSFYKER